MGRCKQLLPLGKETVIARCIETLCQAGIDEIIVVVSAEGKEVAAEAMRFPVRVVINQELEGDMASSVRTGSEALSADITGVVITLCDQPLVQSATVKQLIGAYRSYPNHIIAPHLAGQKGHPLLFPRQVLSELHDCQTLRDVVRNDPSRVIELPVSDVGVLLDMDTPEDYSKICSQVTASDMDER